MPHYNLLSDNQLKMAKSIDLGFYSVILHLEPAYTYKGLKTCPWSGQCAGYCLGNSGQMRFEVARNARIRRTQLLVDHPSEFHGALVLDLCKARRYADSLGLKLTVRLNGTSDLRWESMAISQEGKNIFQVFPEIQFIDYTKSVERALTVQIPNYNLTYSRNEKSKEGEIVEILDQGSKVAVVFDIAKGEPLPKTYKIERRRFRVIDGDISDLRHLDPHGVIVGLRYKKAFSKKTGKSVKVKAGFVILGQ